MTRPGSSTETLHTTWICTIELKNRMIYQARAKYNQIIVSWIVMHIYKDMPNKMQQLWILKYNVNEEV